MTSLQQTLLHGALELATRGPILPCSRDKRPLVGDWPHVATTAPETIQQWWQQDFCGANAGIVTGARSGFFVVDLDRHKDAFDGIASWQQLQAEHEPVSPTYTVATPSGGLHLYFKYPENGQHIPNKAGILPGVDIRGEGGFVVAPPSIGSNGQPYKVLDDTPPAEPTTWLLDLILKPQKTAVSKASDPVRNIRPLGNVKSDRQNYWQTVIDGECQRIHDAVKGESNNILNDASYKIGQKLEACSIRPEDAERILLQKAMANPAIAADGESQALRTIRSGLLSGMDNPKSPAPLPVFRRVAPQMASTMNTKATTAEPWPDPIPLTDRERAKLERDMLPEVLSDMVFAVSSYARCPPELVAGPILACFSAGAMRTYKIHVKNGPKEWLNLFTLSLADSGDGKSSLLNPCKAPLHEAEKELKENSAAWIREEKSRRQSIRARVAHLRAILAKTDVAEERDRLQLDINELEATLGPDPHTLRLLFSDITPEALASRLSENGECGAILSAEPGLLQTIAGRYSRGVPNMDIFLKSYSGEAHTVDRKNLERNADESVNYDGIALETPRLALGICAQPGVFVARKNADQFRASGMDARFLFFYPKSWVGSRQEGKELPENILSRYNALIRHFLPREWKPGIPVVYQELELSKEARETWRSFTYDHLEPRLKPEGDLYSIRDWATRGPGTVLRLTGLFHLATHWSHNPDNIPTSVEANVVYQAIAFWEVCLDHAKAVFEDLLTGTSVADEQVTTLLAWLEKKRPEKFTRRELFAGVRGNKLFGATDTLEPPLAELVDRNFIREVEPVRTGGRQSKTYAVNPKFLASLKPSQKTRP